MAEPQLHTSDYNTICGLLYDWTGIRLQNKRELVIGRLSPRLRALGVTTFREYVERVRREGRRGEEAQAFINQLTTNKTAFFREGHHFEFLKEHLARVVGPRALARRERTIRLWSAACSTGEEAYTLAMVAAEALPSSAGWDVRIRATDIDTQVLATASAGYYEAASLADIPKVHQHWFSPSGAGKVRVSSELARLIAFEQLNLIQDDFGKACYDAIFCRNVIIYFDSANQKRVVERLAERLVPDGRLFLGHSETLVGTTLERVGSQVGVYQRGRTRARTSVRAAVSTTAGRAPSLKPLRSPVRLVTGGSPVRQPAPTMVRSRTRDTPAEDGAPLPHRRIVLGEWAVAIEPSIISTLLGSCVSACLWDEELGIGGMNHFMLPNGSGSAADPANFGVHAMELLINGLMAQGATRRRLRAKAFGAGAVTKALPPNVGEANAAFIRAFLAKEGIPLVVERLGGERPREVFLKTHSGEVLVRGINPKTAVVVEKIEVRAWTGKAQSEPEFKPDDALF